MLNSKDYSACRQAGVMTKDKERQYATIALTALSAVHIPFY